MRGTAKSLMLGLALGVTISAPAVADEITVIREIEADSFDPHKVTARAATEILNFLGDTLVTMDPQLDQIHPGLAKEWTVSDDGLLYTFQLREDVTFCSGKALTADDVVYSIRRWIDEETASPSSWRAGEVESVKAVDDYTVEYRLSEPFSELLPNLAQAFATIINEKSVRKLGDEFGVTGFDGTGPYCWENWTPRNDMQMVRHDAYTWGPSIYENTGPAHLDRIEWRVVPEATTRVAALETGEADITYATPLWAVDQLKAHPEIQVEKPPVYLWTTYLGMKITRDLMGDVTLREALNYAVDREAIAEGVFFGHADPAYQYVRPETPDFNPELQDMAVSYDPEYASQLLEQAGWEKGDDGIREKDGQRLELVLYGFNTWREQLEAIQGMMREVGVDLQLELFDTSVAWGQLQTQDFDLFAMNYPYNSVGEAYNLYFPSENMPSPNRMNWEDDETDQLLEQGKSATNEEERFEAYAKLQEKIYQNYLWIPVVHEQMFVTWNKRVTGVRPHGFYGNGIYKGLDLKLKQ